MFFLIRKLLKNGMNIKECQKTRKKKLLGDQKNCSKRQAAQKSFLAGVGPQAYRQKDRLDWCRSLSLLPVTRCDQKKRLLGRSAVLPVCFQSQDNQNKLQKCFCLHSAKQIVQFEEKLEGKHIWIVQIGVHYTERVWIMAKNYCKTQNPAHRWVPLNSKN